jgi:hypothetical protein
MQAGDVLMLDQDDTTVVHCDRFAHLTVERAIALRWTLRDVLANRTKFLPVADADLELLAEMGLIEMQDDAPALTPAGMAAIE